MLKFRALLVGWLLLLPICRAAPPSSFDGYYLTFMRMPVMDLEDWKVAIDSFSTDGAKQLILWMGGGFPSKKFPATWAYNKEHKNNRENFFPSLIKYAHTKNVRILLALTPYGYDGVNQHTLEHPGLRAKKTDGTDVDPFGIHSWGWSLCPSKPAAQEFMLAYAREMLFDFYPEADGLMIESSDYNVCRCSDCDGQFYDREFPFVEKISQEIWARNPQATVYVYPHYFTGKKVNAGSAIESNAAQKPFDKRWHLFFTPHSAHIDPDLLRQGINGVFSNEGLSLGTPLTLQNGVKTARTHNLGYLPSFEPFSYILPREEFGAAHLIGRRLAPLGFDWLQENEFPRPFNELPAQVLRQSFKLYCENPHLTDAAFRAAIGSHFFGARATAQLIDDLLFLQECVNFQRSWSAASPVVDPAFFKLKSTREQWPAGRKKTFLDRVEQLRQLALRYQTLKSPPEQQMFRLARFIVDRWASAK